MTMMSAEATRPLHRGATARVRQGVCRQPAEGFPPVGRSRPRPYTHSLSCTARGTPTFSLRDRRAGPRGQASCIHGAQACPVVLPVKRTGLAVTHAEDNPVLPWAPHGGQACLKDIPALPVKRTGLTVMKTMRTILSWP